jgi:hypothetical protein
MGLKTEPTWRLLSMARLYGLEEKFLPPTIAVTSPVIGLLAKCAAWSKSFFSSFNFFMWG